MDIETLTKQLEKMLEEARQGIIEIDISTNDGLYWSHNYMGRAQILEKILGLIEKDRKAIKPRE